ncbi:hypothetical protein E6C27_scaffold270G00090 [Cucumis melo var. makuwa]|uniref:DUF4218 domain-containing protein n=1 Tax=Cucumis melo var. makuwa TaxID=1194695 RepID=A0A5A7T486_CUCMM|nr:hypothetical protein E6C27_scaffold270G00090 [Cucumis melo var. makuwa]
MKTRDLGLGYETIHAWSADMKWHRDKCVETDDVLRHPADAEGWKHFDSEYPDFAFDPRNARLGLASDGFNQFALLWTINDFPAHGDLLGWSTKRYQASPICMGDRSSFGIRGRISFMGHRRYLPDNHVWRRSRLHNGKVERRAPPVVMNGHEILEQLGKTKDTTNTRLDLQDLKIRKDLHLVEYVKNKARSEGSIAKVYVMNESSTFCSRYLSGIETQFIRDERNDDSIVEDEIIVDFEIFKQKVRTLCASFVRAISQEEKRLFHWYILNNVDEISEYRK